MRPTRPSRRRLWFLLILVLTVTLVLLWFCRGEDDIAVINGRIYTVDATRPWVDSVVIRDGVIVYAGDRAGADAHIGWWTRLVDLNGRMAMPGIHESHTHIAAALFSEYTGCPLDRDIGPEKLVEFLTACEADRGTRSGWLMGGVYNAMFFPDGAPHKRWLDEAFPDTPVFLEDNTGHNALVNSAALRLAGITSATPDPSGGVYVKDPGTGELTGLLIDQAQWDFRAHLPEPSVFEFVGAVRQAMHHYSAHGVTSLQESAAVAKLLELFGLMERLGMVPVDVYGQLLWRPGSADPRTGTFEEQVAAITDRASLRTHQIHSDYVKIFVDGVPDPQVPTHSTLDPFTGDPDASMLLVPHKELTAALRQFDEEGIKVKLHVAGSGGAHAALDALEAAGVGPGHSLAHGQSLVAEDLQRAVKLGVVVEMSGHLWMGTQFGDLTDQFRFKTFVDSGALVVMGSDWPVSPDINPFPAMAAMTQLGPESVDRHTAIQLATLNGARSVGAQDEFGSLELGKQGSLIVLDRNILEGDVAQMAEAKVLMTVFRGRVVHDVFEEP